MPPPRIEPGFQQPQCCVLTTILRWQISIEYFNVHRLLYSLGVIELFIHTFK